MRRFVLAGSVFATTVLLGGACASDEEAARSETTAATRPADPAPAAGEAYSESALPPLATLAEQATESFSGRVVDANLGTDRVVVDGVAVDTVQWAAVSVDEVYRTSTGIKSGSTVQVAVRSEPTGGVETDIKLPVALDVTEGTQIVILGTAWANGEFDGVSPISPGGLVVIEGDRATALQGPTTPHEIAALARG